MPFIEKQKEIDGDNSNNNQDITINDAFLKEIVKVKNLISAEMKEEPKNDFLEELSDIAEEYIDHIKSSVFESIYEKKYEALKVYIPILVDLELRIINYNKLSIPIDNLDDELKTIQKLIKTQP